jgi:type IV fimbrial biogenesis protein FimT
MLILRKQAGVTLIELLIGMVIFSLLIAMGAPSFGLWIQSTQTRTAAESILSGLQLARTEAVRHNTKVRFDLTEASGAVTWTVTCVTVTTNCPNDSDNPLHMHSAADGGVNARAGIAVTTATPFSTTLSMGTGLPAGVTFDGLGRIPTANIGDDIARIDVTNAVNANARRLVILVGNGGQIRMCDPLLHLSNNPQGCS